MESGRVPFAQQRQERLLELLRAKGSIVVSEVAPLLDVSELTIRRDINALAGRGLVTRVHGGATLADQAGVLLGEQVSQLAGAPGSRFTVGVVVPELSYYWPSVIAGARAAATEAHVRLLLRSSSYDLDDDRRQIRRLLDVPGLDGLIVAPDMEAPQSSALVRWLDTLPKPVVLAERAPPEQLEVRSLEWVASDHALGAVMAVQHLHDQGHRRIGLVVHTPSPTANHLRRGWRDGLLALGLDPDEQLTGETVGFTEPGRDALIAALLERCRTTGTTALLVHPDPSALSLAQHCTDAGIAIPGDLAVVAYDDELAALAQPPLTAVLPPKSYVGRLAVELLVARLREGRRRPPHRVSISPLLNIRESSRRRSSPD